MKRPPRSLTVAKAVHLPHHSLSDRLRKALKAVDALHSPPRLKPVTVLMNRAVPGAVFDAYTGTGPYSIYLNPDGSHPELSLLHEVGHYLEWQAIPKSYFGQRDFGDDPLFARWLAVVLQTPTAAHLLTLLSQQPEDSEAFADMDYRLRPVELWARAYAQYIARKSNLPMLLQQIAAENKVFAGIIPYQAFWAWDEFSPVQEAMEAIFTYLEWEP